MGRCIIVGEQNCELISPCHGYGEVLFYAVALDPKAALGIATSNFAMTDTKTINTGEGVGPDLSGWDWILFAHPHEPWLSGW